jgi:ribonuclease HI
MRLFLLTDGSLNPKLGIGFGAYLAFAKTPETLAELGGLIKIKRFKNTSSTKLELQTLIWALSEISEKEVVSYTDSQNIIGLLYRKERLIRDSYCSKGGRQIKNHELYKEFFESIERFDIQFHLISGHKPSRNKDRIDEMFSFVDRASRNALRSYSRINSNHTMHKESQGGPSKG